MTTTPAPTDIDLIRKHIQLAEDWAEYGHVGDPNWHVARTLIKQVPALLDELAKTRRELEQATAQRNLAADWLEDSAEAKRERDAAREELAKTRAELDHLRKVLAAANETTAAAQQIVTAALADGTARVNPATTAEPAASGPVIWCNRCAELVSPQRLDEHNASPAHRSREPRPLAEPADEPKATVPPTYNLPPKHCGELRVHAPHADSDTICDGRTLPDAKPAEGDPVVLCPELDCDFDSYTLAEMDIHVRTEHAEPAAG